MMNTKPDEKLVAHIRALIARDGHVVVSGTFHGWQRALTQLTVVMGTHVPGMLRGCVLASATAAGLFDAPNKSKGNANDDAEPSA